MKAKWVSAFMDTAERFAQLSSAVKLKVGSVVVKDNRIISIGYNGTPTGWDNRCEHLVSEYNEVTKSWYLTEELVTNDDVIHAEANAILKLAKDGESGNGADLFCTHAPCIHCAKLIYGAGIRKVFYREDYKSTDGLDFLNKCNIEIEKV